MFLYVLPASEILFLHAQLLALLPGIGSAPLSGLNGARNEAVVHDPLEWPGRVARSRRGHAGLLNVDREDGKLGRSELAWNENSVSIAEFLSIY